MVRASAAADGRCQPSFLLLKFVTNITSNGIPHFAGAPKQEVERYVVGTALRTDFLPHQPGFDPLGLPDPFRLRFFCELQKQDIDKDWRSGTRENLDKDY